MSLRFMEPMKEMCESCPFGNTKAQRHMRDSLQPGRFEEIAQSIWQGASFACHKTTNGEEDNYGDYHYTGAEKQCRGALEFVARAAEKSSACRREGIVNHLRAIRMFLKIVWRYDRLTNRRMPLWAAWQLAFKTGARIHRA